MRRRKRRTGGEINLTPLLDVLFSILFLIMLANFSSQNQLQQAFAESGGQLEEEIEALTKERDDLAEENARLLEEGEALAEDYALLQGENLELSGEKELLTAENQKLGGEITGLMNVISQLNSDNSALAAEASQMQEEIDELSHEKRVVEGLSGTYQAFETMCTFVTVINSARGDQHILEFFVGEDEEPRARVVMTSYTKDGLKQEVEERLSGIIEELSVPGASEAMPVFIVFHQNESVIFHSEESTQIISALDDIQNEYPQVYKEIRVYRE